MEEFKECSSSHHTKTISKYPKNRVPIILFKKEPNNINSIEYKQCEDCRDLDKRKSIKKRDKHTIKAKNAKQLVSEGLSNFGYCTIWLSKAKSEFQMKICMN